MVCTIPPDGANAMSRRNKLIGLLAGSRLAAAFVSVAQFVIVPLKHFADGLLTGDDPVKEFKLLAEKGDATAQYNLGVMYFKGEGVPPDSKEAVMWFRKAAEQGDANSQSILGGMYREGEGVTKDYVLAHMWYNLAATQGNEFGKLTRDLIAQSMTPDQIAEAQRLAREWKPYN